jgi:periplasmic glucans biosynthesis protein
MLDRRTLLAAAAATTAALAADGFGTSALAQQGLSYGRTNPFSYDVLKVRARDLAARPYAPQPIVKPDVQEAIDYDAHGKIRYKPELALFADGPGDYPVTFFHVGRYFKKPVRMHAVDGEPGRQNAREILYSPEYFDMPADSPAKSLPETVGFAGFRFQESRKGHPGPKGQPLDWKKNDWVAFLGASYFRAIGQLYQYGLSARGIAVDVAVSGQAEEFPDFTHVWFETPKAGDETVTVYALLDGPSVTGAYRFVMRRGAGVIMDIDATLNIRKGVSRLGIAPLTSMYWYSETRKTTAVDWRPEVHDSDGLAIWTGAGERIWRPLNNPPFTVASSFADENPKGFGLLQRDRETGHYLDGVFYEKRPSLWIEPKDGWGKGSVQLIEIPTDDEIHDNIVAMWVPAEAAKARDAYDLHYRVHWLADEPFPTPLARCVATRLGNGGQPGTARPKGVRKFVVEFLGGPLVDVPSGKKVEPVLWASRGTFQYSFAEAVPNDVPGHWRASFDLVAGGNEPVELRCFLKSGDTTLSETWLYQYHPI